MIATYCKLIIKAGWRNQLPAVRNIYNCKYYISTAEQVNTALWKCLLYRSAHQEGERENMILQFSAAPHFADIENVFLRYWLLRRATEGSARWWMNAITPVPTPARNTLLPLILERKQLKEPKNHGNVISIGFISFYLMVSLMTPIQGNVHMWIFKCFPSYQQYSPVLLLRSENPLTPSCSIGGGNGKTNCSYGDALHGKLQMENCSSCLSLQLKKQH